jgi:hypothetical protein
VLNQHKLVMNKAPILTDNEGTENLAAEEVDRSRLFRQLTRIIKDKGSLVNDNPIDALAGMVRYRTERHIADIELLAGISRAALRLG